MKAIAVTVRDSRDKQAFPYANLKRLKGQLLQIRLDIPIKKVLSFMDA